MKSLKDYKYKISFATKVKPLIQEDTDKYLALASKSNLKDFLPTDVNFDKKIDFLGFSGEFCTVNRLNGNDDAIQTKEALDIVKLLPYSFIDTEHSRKSIIGVITSAHFNEFGSNKVLTADEVKDLNAPFNISIAGIIWKLVNPDLAEYIESSGDPSSNNYGKIFLSWELLFDKANIVEIDASKKNIKDGKIITNESDIEKLESKLRANGGKGYTDTGKRLGRIPIDEIIPAGCALTENPAGEDLKPITILSSGPKVIEKDDSESKLECQASSEHYTEKCSCGNVISTCRCSSPNKKIIIKENGCKDCQEKMSKADFTGFSDNSSKEAYSSKDKSEEIKNQPVQQNVTDMVKNQTASSTTPLNTSNIITTNKDIPPKKPDYKFGKCPNCGNVSDYNAFIKTWNSSQGTIGCDSCTKTSLSTSWEFNENNIWKPENSAENVAQDKKHQIVANNENNMSHLNNVNVNNNIKTMKISSIKDITDENLKEAKASEITEVLSSEIKKISDSYVQKEQEKENLVKTTKQQFDEANAALETTKNELKEVKANLDKLINENAQKAKLETFSARMNTIDSEFELNDKEKEILGSKIKSIEKEEDWTKFLEETNILLAAKKKNNMKTSKDKDPDKDGDDDSTKKGDTDKDAAGKDKKESKASKEEDKTVLDDAIKNGDKKETAIANSTAGSSPSLTDRMKTAFGPTNWSVENKKKNRNI